MVQVNTLKQIQKYLYHLVVYVDMQDYERSLEFCAHFNFMIDLTPQSSHLTKNHRGEFF